MGSSWYCVCEESVAATAHPKWIILTLLYIYRIKQVYHWTVLKSSIFGVQLYMPYPHFPYSITHDSIGNDTEGSVLLYLIT